MISLDALLKATGKRTCTNVHQWTKLIKLKLSNHYNVCTIQHEY